MLTFQLRLELYKTLTLTLKSSTRSKKTATVLKKGTVCLDSFTRHIGLYRRW